MGEEKTRMTKGIRIPRYAAKNAEKGLRKRKKYEDKPVLSVEEANEKGIHSGITTARTLIRGSKEDENLSPEMAGRIKNFLSRTHGQLQRAENKEWDTKKILASINVWGGQQDQRFLRYLERRTK
jgi:hypothetical protein